MDTREKETPDLSILQKRRGPVLGDFYLRGYADGFHGRKNKPPRGKRSRDAYTRGYQEAVTMKQASQHKPVQ